MSYEEITLLISLLAVIISTVSLVRSRKLGGEQLRLAEEQLKLERITAELASHQIKEIEDLKKLKDVSDIQVALYRSGAHAEFVITNSGKGKAYDLNLELVNCKDQPLYDARDKLPYPELRPGHAFRLGAAFHIGSPTQYQVKVSWRDAVGLKEDTFWLS